jgi:thioredoxin reductase
MTEVAIVGTGPYGLSLAAHLRSIGVSYRIFGRPMETWLSHMPTGMLLKSDGFASNISAPNNGFTLKEFCTQHGIEYADKGTPVRLDTFSAYGLAFRDRLVPDLEDKLVSNIERSGEGFVLRTDDGDSLTAKHVVLAVGIGHFNYVPANLAHLAPEFLTHSYQHAELESLRGRSVTVIGAGSSAIDLASLLYESGVDVQLVARVPALKFHDKTSDDKRRSLWQRLRSPSSGLGPGLRSRLYANSPNVFRYLPENMRLETLRTFLGPAGGWFAKEKVLGKVPLMLGYAAEAANVRDHKVELKLKARDGSERTITAEHVIAATGYRVDINRLQFLSSNIRANIKTVQNAPILSADFESSVSGLHFLGLAAANSFGPVMRFAFGADFAARQLSQSLKKGTRHRKHKVVSVPRDSENERTGARRSLSPR